MDNEDIFQKIDSLTMAGENGGGRRGRDGRGGGSSVSSGRYSSDHSGLPSARTLRGGKNVVAR